MLGSMPAIGRVFFSLFRVAWSLALGTRAGRSPLWIEIVAPAMLVADLVVEDGLTMRPSVSAKRCSPRRKKLKSGTWAQLPSRNVPVQVLPSRPLIRSSAATTVDIGSSWYQGLTPRRVPGSPTSHDIIPTPS